VAAAGNKPKALGSARKNIKHVRCKKRDVDDYFTLLTDGWMDGRLSGVDDYAPVTQGITRTHREVVLLTCTEECPWCP